MRAAAKEFRYRQAATALGRDDCSTWCDWKSCHPLQWTCPRRPAGRSVSNPAACCVVAASRDVCGQRQSTCRTTQVPRTRCAKRRQQGIHHVAMCLAIRGWRSWLPCRLNKINQSSPEVSYHNAITRMAVQSLHDQIWRSAISISTKLKLYIILAFYNLPVRKISARTAHGQLPRDMHSRLMTLFNAVCESYWESYGITMCEIMRWDGQPLAIVQARHFSLFGHIAWMPYETDAKKISTASPWTTGGHPCTIHGWRPEITFPWIKQLRLRIVQSGDRCLRLAMHS